MKTRKTGRGFQVIEFDDSIQQSSAIDFESDRQGPGESMLWLGRNNDRMHLNKEQVQMLCLCMTYWLENGRFPIEDTE